MRLLLNLTILIAGSSAALAAVGPDWGLRPQARPVLDDIHSFAPDPKPEWSEAQLRQTHALPPLQFDHPFPGKVTIITAEGQEEARQLCRLPDPGIVLGCELEWRKTASQCFVVVVPSALADPQAVMLGHTAETNFRHEQGHCNGWPGDHSDPIAVAGAPMVVAQVESMPVDEGTEPPPPPPRRHHREPRYAPYYGPPPGVIYIPAEGRALPCLPTLLSFGLVRFCI